MRRSIPCAMRARSAIISRARTPTAMAATRNYRPSADHLLIGSSQLRGALISIRIVASREDRYATSELERLSAPFFGLVPGLPVAGDGADKTHPPTPSLAGTSSGASGPFVGTRRRTKPRPIRAEAYLRLRR